MEFGICLQSVTGVRSEPSHKSELVTQMLFGELLRINHCENGWINAELSYDDYIGWIHESQVHPLSEKEFLDLFNAETAISTELVQLVSNETRQVVYPILVGSSLPSYDNGYFSVLGERYFYDGTVTGTSPVETVTSPRDKLKIKQGIVNDAMIYLNSPYLWGGRTPFGIDCSGLVQMVYKLQKIKLLRDASQQAVQGEALNFVSEAEPGDLAFFDDPEGNITHVGLMIDQSRIIHASGRVRIDMIDHEGIYNNDEQRYTHRLRVIKRLI